MPADLPWVRFSSAAMEAALFRAGARSDADIAAFTVGMLAGIAGRDKPSECAGIAGWHFGASLAEEAAAYRDQISTQRRQAAETRWSKRMQPHASAMQPHANAMQPHANAMQSDAITRQDKTRQDSGSSDSRSTPREAAAAATPPDGDWMRDEPGPNAVDSRGGNGQTPIAPRLEADPVRKAAMLASNPLPRQPSLADLRVLHPALLIFDADREAAEACLRLYGADAWQRVLARLAPVAKARPAGKRRIMFAEVQQALTGTALAREDFERAGLEPPDWAIPQSQLDALTNQELANYGPRN